MALTEVYFQWTCPECKTKQTEGVNAVEGPCLSLTCGSCGKAFEDYQLNLEDANAWDDALAEAEKIDGVH